MITFTKEQLIASAYARIEFAEMMLSGELEPLKERTWSIELELARIALASLEAEPIYQLVNDDWYDTDKDTYDVVVGSGSRGRIVYTAPPAPVVPEEINVLQAANLVLMLGVLDYGIPTVAMKVWNACRAAMLKTNL
ncbi:hypothetical protein OR191_002418 [Enterobacter hormaechei]|nr:hypothetical protein [Enterobacter hormaechei]